MQCETMECSKESGLVCKKKKSCRKLWQSVCDDDGCTNGNVIVCEETGNTRIKKTVEWKL